MSSDTTIMSMFNVIRQTVKQAEADGISNAEKSTALGDLIDDSGQSNSRSQATGIYGHLNGTSTDRTSGTVHAESMDVDELESHADPAEKHEATKSTASEMVMVRTPDSIWRETDTAITADPPLAGPSVASTDNSPPLKRTQNRVEGMLPQVSIASPVIV
jgi:hypothetical protein